MAQVRGLEVSFDQDLDDDGHLGVPSATVVESAGAVNLLLGEGGYFIGNESRPFIYEGAQLGALAGWTYLGVESGSRYAYDVLLSDGTTLVVFHTDASGVIVDLATRSVSELWYYEGRFDQDLNGNGIIDETIEVDTGIAYAGTFSGLSSGSFWAAYDPTLNEVIVYAYDPVAGDLSFSTALVDPKLGTFELSIGDFVVNGTLRGNVFTASGSSQLGSLVVSGSAVSEQLLSDYMGYYTAYGQNSEGSFEYAVLILPTGEILYDGSHTVFGQDGGAGVIDANGNFDVIDIFGDRFSGRLSLIPEGLGGFFSGVDESGSVRLIREFGL